MHFSVPMPNVTPVTSTPKPVRRRTRALRVPTLEIEYVLTRRTRGRISFTATSDAAAKQKAFELLGIAKGMRTPENFKAADGHKVIRVSNGMQIYPQPAH